ncbi:winged helix-turn-helix transcriptional regulator [Altererythrobacter sp. Root672]|uniref:winged helix-turn-helix transcriptional regulator n=1 Tax=Altererythrobacter sp. Root672 TaxID=1736584 RepID=UPI0006FAD4FD|nr:helix-turn-helix domain-containing protein [Altererythrobacter sp. Root672]KRA80715.1 HxlR family transcriptional regulator [Altererythrobacter sp. Root672]
MRHRVADEQFDLDSPEPRRPMECPVEDWLSFLGHRWNALILWHLKLGAKRYGELAACLPGISSKVLSERLLGLEDRGLLTRLASPTFPRSVTYGLTLAGSDLVCVLDQLETWSRHAPHES